MNFFFLGYRKFLEDIQSVLLSFFIMGNPFFCVCLAIFAEGLISEVYRFCPDLKSLFTIAAISGVQTEVSLKIPSGSEAYMRAYTQVQGQTSPVVCLFIVQPHQVLYWFY